MAKERTSILRNPLDDGGTAGKVTSADSRELDWDDEY